MIRINLASRKQSGISGEGKSKGGAKALLGKFDLDQLKDLPIGKVVLSIAAGCGAYYFLDQYKIDEVAKLETILKATNQSNTNLQADLGKFKIYDSVKKSMDEDEVTIRTKLETIQKLIVDRADSLKIILAIANTIPKDVWLSSFRMEKMDISIKGGSIGFNPISDFMKNLHEVVYFASVDLVDTQESKEGGDQVSANFELNVKRR